MANSDDCEWSQGDVAPEITTVPFLSDLENFTEVSAVGGIILTQTCDLLKPDNKRPFVQIAAAVAVNKGQFMEAKLERSPRYAFIPALAEQNAVADLDIVATFHKSILQTLTRVPGCKTDEERRRLAGVLGRHRTRYAFPDGLNEEFSRLRDWIKSASSKEGDAKNFVDSVTQFRLSNFDPVEQPTLTCLIGEDCSEADRERWGQNFIPKMEELLEPWCSDCSILIASLANITAAEYREGVRLDFEYLSAPRK